MTIVEAAIVESVNDGWDLVAIIRYPIGTNRHVFHREVFAIIIWDVKDCGAVGGGVDVPSQRHDVWATLPGPVDDHLVMTVIQRLLETKQEYHQWSIILVMIVNVIQLIVA